MGANISSTDATSMFSCCADSGSDGEERDFESDEPPQRRESNEGAATMKNNQSDKGSPHQLDENCQESKTREHSLSVELPREHDANRNAPCSVAFDEQQPQTADVADEMLTKVYPQLPMRGMEPSQPDAFSENVSPQTTLTSLDSMGSDRTGSLPSGNIVSRQVVTASRPQRLPPRPLRSERVELASPATSMSVGGKGHSSSGSSHPTSSSSKNGSKLSLERGGVANPFVPAPHDSETTMDHCRDGSCSPSTSLRMPQGTLSFSNRNTSRDGSTSGLQKSGSGVHRGDGTSIPTSSLRLDGEGACLDSGCGCNDSPMKREQLLGKTASSPSLQKSQRAVSVGLGNSFVSAMTHSSAAQDPDLQPSQWESWGTDYGGGMSPGLRKIKLSTLLDSETMDDL